MLPPRACTSLLFSRKIFNFIYITNVLKLDAFLTLNAIRILTIIALLLVFASNIVTLADDIKAVNRFVAARNNASSTNSTSDTIANTNTTVQDYDYILFVILSRIIFDLIQPSSSDKLKFFRGSTVPNQPAGAFWAVLNRLFIIFQAVVLILSEIGFPSAFFNRYFPVLGKNFGLGALGLIQMLLVFLFIYNHINFSFLSDFYSIFRIGAAILSHHVNTFTLVSAFFLFSLGCVNVLVGLIFRESAKSKRSISSWREHGKSVLPTHVAGVDLKGPPPFVSKLYTGGTTSTNSMGSMSNESNNNNNNNTGAERTQDRFAGFGFGRQGEKAAGLKGYLISKPVESLPRYAPK